MGSQRFRGATAALKVGCVLLAGCCLPVAATAMADSFPPRANAAWIYDPQQVHDGHTRVRPGHFLHALSRYDELAPPPTRIEELYVYGGDMEMYCPHHKVAQCRPRDFHVYYSRAAQHGRAPAGQQVSNASVQAYARGLKSHAATRGVFFSPVIDGTTGRRGPLRNFDRLSAGQARAFADKLARQLCADPRVAGVQFDLEPFDVRTKAGQYYFFRRIARDFAGKRWGCVDGAHPQGRYFSIFTSANRIRPHTASARHVAKIMGVAGNGYLIASLYDLSAAPAGHRTPVARYRHLVDRQVRDMHRWADRLGIKYQFAVPAAATAHEYGRCRGRRCQSGQAAEAVSAAERRQLAYLKAALNAVDASGATRDRNYLGTAVWAWSPHVNHGAMHFTPAQPTPAVRRYLQHHL